MGDRLSLATLGHLAPEHRPLIDPAALSVGVVHLGAGAFHRAHQVAFIEDAAAASGEGCWGVCAYSMRSRSASDSLAAQDGLYSLRLRSSTESSLRVIASLREARFAGEGGDGGDASLGGAGGGRVGRVDGAGRVADGIADPAVRLVTLTVTEQGYRHDPASGRLRHDEALLADAAGGVDGADAAGGGPPRTVLGQLVRGFEARRRAGHGPITVASCDNLPSNGRLLAALVEEFLQLPGRFEPGLSQWVADNVAFPCSVVDRIVPAATGADRARATAELGVLDEAAVVAEPFRQWVIEDRFAAPRPALEAAGVQLTADVAPYEELKLRVLNGSHSALAYLGALAGAELIAEALERPGIAAFVRSMTDDEVIPSLRLVPGVRPSAYRDGVLERFANPLLAHRCLQVATDGSLKLPQRILATVRHRLAAGTEPRRCLLVVAAWVRAIVVGREDTGRRFEVADPRAPELRETAGEPSETQARRALGLLAGADLAGDERAVQLLAGALDDLGRAPAEVVAADYGGR